MSGRESPVSLPPLARAASDHSPTATSELVHRLYEVKKAPEPEPLPRNLRISTRRIDDMMARLSKIPHRNNRPEVLRPHGPEAPTFYVGGLTDCHMPEYDPKSDHNLNLFWARKDHLAAHPEAAFKPLLVKPPRRPRAPRPQPAAPGPDAEPADDAADTGDKADYLQGGKTKPTRFARSEPRGAAASRLRVVDRELEAERKASARKRGPLKPAPPPRGNRATEMRNQARAQAEASPPAPKPAVRRPKPSPKPKPKDEPPAADQQPKKKEDAPRKSSASTASRAARKQAKTLPKPERQAKPQERPPAKPRASTQEPSEPRRSINDEDYEVVDDSAPTSPVRAAEEHASTRSTSPAYSDDAESIPPTDDEAESPQRVAASKAPQQRASRSPTPRSSRASTRSASDAGSLASPDASAVMQESSAHDERREASAAASGSRRASESAEPANAAASGSRRASESAEPANAAASGSRRASESAEPANAAASGSRRASESAEPANAAASGSRRASENADGAATADGGPLNPSQRAALAATAHSSDHASVISSRASSAVDEATRRRRKEEKRRMKQRHLRVQIIKKFFGDLAEENWHQIGAGDAPERCLTYLSVGTPNLVVADAGEPEAARWSLLVDAVGFVQLQLASAPHLVVTVLPDGTASVHPAAAGQVSPEDAAAGPLPSDSDAPTAVQWFEVVELANNNFALESAAHRGKLLEATLDQDVPGLLLVADDESSSFCELVVVASEPPEASPEFGSPAEAHEPSAGGGEQAAAAEEL